MAHWRQTTGRADAMRGIGEDQAAYVTGWTISGLAALGAVLAIWLFGI